jgi:pyridoxamine 5'-phosphate oxidase
MYRGDQIYKNGQLDETNMDPDPICEFITQWALAEATYGEEAAAMSLSTVCAALRPHSRMVLLKKQEGRCFFFYSQYRSQKAREIEFSSFGALLFFWPELGKQIRIEGSISKISAEDSAAYFHTRPRESQIGAWASVQSEPVVNRTALETQVSEFESRFGSKPIPYPPHWGGYCLTATDMEFWQGRPARLHDRIAYTYQDTGWQRTRLYP